MCNHPEPVNEFGETMSQITSNPKRHQHAEFIIAWANGETIEFKPPHSNEWKELQTSTPEWLLNYEYRIKDKEPNYGIIAANTYLIHSHLSDEDRWEVVSNAVIKVYKAYTQGKEKE
jgi:hypothetical protein